MEILLTKGNITLVDDEDFGFLSQWKWHLSDGGYAMRNNHKNLGVRKYTNKQIRMHRAVNKTPDGLFTDHINGNKLDNRKCNLRTCNKSLNGINRGKPANNTSGYKGIYWDSWTGKWRSEIGINGRRIRLGRFRDIKEAIEARVKAEKIYHAI